MVRDILDTLGVVKLKNGRKLYQPRKTNFSQRPRNPTHTKPAAKLNLYSGGFSAVGHK